MLPSLLQSIGGDSIPIFRGKDAPERTSVCIIDRLDAFHVNLGEANWVADDIAVETERRVGGRVGESTARWGRLGENGNRVAESADRAVGSGPWKEGRGSWKLDVDWGWRRVVIGRWRNNLSVCGFIDRGWHSRYGRGLGGRASAVRGERVGSLTAFAAMRKLMVMKATGQFSLLQVVGNVLVGHFLETSLEEIDLLQ